MDRELSSLLEAKILAFHASCVDFLVSWGCAVIFDLPFSDVPVNTILPGFVLSALEATPKVTEKFFFWSEREKLESIVRSRQTRLRKLLKLANVPNGDAYRFRDTFTFELLLAGVPIERVSILLGHQSVRITEKHHAPWVRSRPTGSGFG